MKKVILLSLLPLTTMATPIKGFFENYQDWDLVCDNLGTCRMAGYQEDEGFDNRVSLLFTRQAGEDAPINAELIFLDYDENDKPIKLDDKIQIILNGKSLGTIQNLKNSSSKLSAKQTTELLTALKDHADIQFISGQFKRYISDKGATAAMLKMDEFQQRLNTPSALVRQGQDKRAVLAPQAIPKIEAVKINNRKTVDLQRGEKNFDNVLTLLRQSNGTNENADNYCSALHQDEGWSGLITQYPLTKGNVLVETICIMAAYQHYNYYAVMDEKLSKVEQVLASQYNDVMYDDKKHILTVIGSFKSRGIGDCWHGKEAVWNGKIFIRTSEWTTGSCKGFTGGAWQLPIFVSEINVK